MSSVEHTTRKTILGSMEAAIRLPRGSIDSVVYDYLSTYVYVVIEDKINLAVCLTSYRSVRNANGGR